MIYKLQQSNRNLVNAFLWWPVTLRQHGKEDNLGNMIPKTEIQHRRFHPSEMRERAVCHCEEENLVDQG